MRSTIQISILRKLETHQITEHIPMCVNGIVEKIPLYTGDNLPLMYLRAADYGDNAYINCTTDSWTLLSYFDKLLSELYPQQDINAINYYYIDDMKTLEKFLTSIINYDGEEYYKKIIQELHFFADLWLTTRQKQPGAYEDAWCIVIQIN